MTYRYEDDFQAVFWETKRVLAQASAAAFARHGVRDGQQYVLRCLWDEDGLPPSEVARRLRSRDSNGHEGDDTNGGRRAAAA